MYATPEDFVQFVDYRNIADLVSDNNIRPTEDDLLTDPNVILSLSSASGKINTAILVAQRYTIAQLEALTGDDANILKMITCWLAFGILINRRGKNPEVWVAYKEAEDYLNQMRRGETLFNVASDVGVGVAQESFPTTAQWQEVNSVRTATKRYFPTRRNQQVAS